MEGLYLRKPEKSQLTPHEAEVCRLSGRLLDVMLDGVDEGRVPMTRDEAIQKVSEVAGDIASIKGLIDRYGGEEFVLHAR